MDQMKGSASSVSGVPRGLFVSMGTRGNGSAEAVVMSKLPLDPGEVCWVGPVVGEKILVQTKNGRLLWPPRSWAIRNKLIH